MSDIEACRTCGVFFLLSSNYLRHLFGSEPEMIHVRQVLESWNVKLNETDHFPQYICTVCLLEFRKIFKFQHACLETQEQLRQLYTMQQENLKKMHIKTELRDDVVFKQEPVYKTTDTEEQNVCAFIYVDDLSDSEYDNEGETTNVPHFKVPHLPLKEEIIEEARVPFETTIKTCNDEVPQTEQMSMLALTPQLTNEDNKLNVNDLSNIPSGVQCELCLYVSADQQEHRQHVLRIHESKPLQCHICGKQFKAGTTQTRLKYHLKWHRINKHIKCPQCGFHCASRDVLNEHTRAVHTKVPCKICGRRLLPKKMRSHMEEHQLEESAASSVECPYCLGGFTDEIQLNEHILTTHPEQTVDGSSAESSNIDYLDLDEETQDSVMKSGSETEASSTSTTSTTMSFSPDDKPLDTSHSYMGEMENEESNDYDLKTTDSDSYETTLEDDMSSVDLTAQGLDEMLFTCAECPQSFAKVEQLIAHAENAHQEKSNFSCSVCGKKFDLKFSLNRHMKRHKNITC